MPTTLNPAEMSWDDIRQLVANLAIQSAETDRRMQETDRLIRGFSRLVVTSRMIM